MEEENMQQRKVYTEEFKKQMVNLYNAGKSAAEISGEYEITISALFRWIQRINKTGSTREKDNRSELENEVIKLRKENKKLLLENEILKQAALIFAQK